MREKLVVCQDLALVAAQHAQTKEKLWQGKPLEPKYQGPFTIIDK